MSPSLSITAGQKIVKNCQGAKKIKRPEIAAHYKEQIKAAQGEAPGLEKKFFVPYTQEELYKPKEKSL